MYTDFETFLNGLNKAAAIPGGRNRARVFYGRIADVDPAKVKDFAERVWGADKTRRENRLSKLRELNAPPVVIDHEKKMLAKCADYDTWKMKSMIGGVFRKIWGDRVDF